MIKLDRKRTGTAIPADFLGQKLVEKHVDMVDRYFTGKEAAKPMAFVSSKWKSAKAKVRADSAKKCAYCEASTSTVAHGDVEHFRPKSIYWWLAYDFDNYLFACQICNQIYKGDNFPIPNGAVRLNAPAMPAARPATPAATSALATSLTVDASLTNDIAVRTRLASEVADLVHPYFEDPEPLFVYEADVSNEEVWIKPSAAPRAQPAFAAAEKYYGLNREELRRDRYNAYSTLAVFKGVLDDGQIGAATRKMIEREFLRVTQSKFPFAGMHRYFLRSWSLIGP